MQPNSPSLSDEEFAEIFGQIKTIAVVGASDDEAKPSHKIPLYLQRQGYRIIPVNPSDEEVLGEKAYKSLEEIPEPVDAVDVFRPSNEAAGIARSAALIGAKVLWLQSGISSQEAADIASDAGMQIVMDECMGATHKRLGLGR
ncbi:MAG TPA: CoA-binding protein [Actinomycetota bacterium]|nr:CoA-binding protein [Actinomycetota bacterium]